MVCPAAGGFLQLFNSSDPSASSSQECMVWEQSQMTTAAVADNALALESSLGQYSCLGEDLELACDADGHMDIEGAAQSELRAASMNPAAAETAMWCMGSAKNSAADHGILASCSDGLPGAEIGPSASDDKLQNRDGKPQQFILPSPNKLSQVRVKQVLDGSGNLSCRHGAYSSNASLTAEASAEVRSSDTSAEVRSSDTSAEVRSSDTSAEVRSFDTSAAAASRAGWPQAVPPSNVRAAVLAGQSTPLNCSMHTKHQYMQHQQPSAEQSQTGTKRSACNDMQDCIQDPDLFNALNRELLNGGSSLFSQLLDLQHCNRMPSACSTPVRTAVSVTGGILQGLPVAAATQSGLPSAAGELLTVQCCQQDRQYILEMAGKEINSSIEAEHGQHMLKPSGAGCDPGMAMRRFLYEDQLGVMASAGTGDDLTLGIPLVMQPAAAAGTSSPSSIQSSPIQQVDSGIRDMAAMKPSRIHGSRTSQDRRSIDSRSCWAVRSGNASQVCIDDCNIEGLFKVADELDVLKLTVSDGAGDQSNSDALDEYEMADLAAQLKHLEHELALALALADSSQQ
jgi:hypothetical protein